MKFDVVVGNPPYNNDIYLDFVMLGHKLTKDKSLWITPAKFWAKSTCDKDTIFRDFIRKYGEYFVIYRNCKEIFDINEPGGIAYYILKRIKTNSVYNIKCIHKSSIAFQSECEAHKDLEFLPLNTLSIINKLGESDFKNVINPKRNYFQKISNLSENLYIDRITPKGIDDVTIMQGNQVCGYINKSDLKTLENLDKYKCIQNCMCGSGLNHADATGLVLGMNRTYILKPNEIGKDSYYHLRFFDTESEANHFVEFMHTKLVNFAYICGVCGLTNNAEFYRYIPNQATFDCIFEDKPMLGYTPDENGEYIDKDGNKHCSLYVKYKLTDEEINIIESVIKERK